MFVVRSPLVGVDHKQMLTRYLPAPDTSNFASLDMNTWLVRNRRPASPRKGVGSSMGGSFLCGISAAFLQLDPGMPAEFTRFPLPSYKHMNPADQEKPINRGKKEPRKRGSLVCCRLRLCHSGMTLAACRPLGPFSTSNETDCPSTSVLKPLP